MCGTRGRLGSQSLGWGFLAEECCTFLDGRESSWPRLRFGLKWLPDFAGNVCMARCGMEAVLDRPPYLAELNNQCKVQNKLFSVFQLAHSNPSWGFLCSIMLYSFHAAKLACGRWISEWLYRSSSTSASKNASFLTKTVTNEAAIFFTFYSGLFCETPPPMVLLQTSPCDNYECQNGAQCIVAHQEPVCRCLAGFAGQKCEKLITVNFVGKDSYVELPSAKIRPQANISLQVCHAENILCQPCTFLHLHLCIHTCFHPGGTGPVSQDADKESV